VRENRSFASSTDAVNANGVYVRRGAVFIQKMFITTIKKNNEVNVQNRRFKMEDEDTI
jgi:hypothetical protein